ncbi:MAG: hypothetical protein AB7P76_05200 [Candidatus Melainabacteria bacterium]
MAQLSRLKDAEITNGNIINADDLDAEFNQLIAGHNDLNSRTTNLEQENMTIAGIKTFSGTVKADTLDERTTGNGVAIDGTVLKDSSILVSRTSDLTGIPDGTVWYNSAEDLLKLQQNNATQVIATQQYVEDTANTPEDYISPGSAAPVYNSASSVSIAGFYGKSANNTQVIQISSPATVSMTTLGLNGLATDATETASTHYYLYAILDSLSNSPNPGYLISPKNVAGGETLTGLPFAQSATLTGTIATTSGQSLITGTSTTFLSDYKAGQKIVITDGDTLTVQSVDSDTQMTATANASVSVSGKSHYRLSPYNTYRQLPIAITNDASGNLIPFTVGGSWPRRPSIYYDITPTHVNTGGSITAGSTVTLSGGTATSFTTVDLSAFVPGISQMAVLQSHGGDNNATYFQIRNAGGSAIQPINNGAGYSSQQLKPQKTSGTRAIEYRRMVGTGQLYLDVTGYVVTGL